MQPAIRSAAGTLIGEPVPSARRVGNHAPPFGSPTFRFEIRRMGNAGNIAALGPEQCAGHRTVHLTVGHRQLAARRSSGRPIFHAGYGDLTTAARADIPQPRGSARSRPVALCIQSRSRTRVSRSPARARTGTAGSLSNPPRARGEPTVALARRDTPPLGFPSSRRQAERGSGTRSRRSCAFACGPTVSDSAM